MSSATSHVEKGQAPKHVSKEIPYCSNSNTREFSPVNRVPLPFHRVGHGFRTENVMNRIEKGFLAHGTPGNLISSPFVVRSQAQTQVNPTFIMRSTRPPLLNLPPGLIAKRPEPNFNTKRRRVRKSAALKHQLKTLRRLGTSMPGSNQFSGRSVPSHSHSPGISYVSFLDLKKHMDQRRQNSWQERQSLPEEIGSHNRLEGVNKGSESVGIGNNDGTKNLPNSNASWSQVQKDVKTTATETPIKELITLSSSSDFESSDEEKIKTLQEKISSSLTIPHSQAGNVEYDAKDLKFKFPTDNESMPVNNPFSSTQTVVNKNPWSSSFGGFHGAKNVLPTLSKHVEVHSRCFRNKTMERKDAQKKVDELNVSVLKECERLLCQDGSSSVKVSNSYSHVGGSGGGWRTYEQVKRTTAAASQNTKSGGATDTGGDGGKSIVQSLPKVIQEKVKVNEKLLKKQQTKPPSRHSQTKTSVAKEPSLEDAKADFVFFSGFEAIEQERQYAEANSFGFFVTTESKWGNTLMPAFPRF